MQRKVENLKLEKNRIKIEESYELDLVDPDGTIGRESIKQIDIYKFSIFGQAEKAYNSALNWISSWFSDSNGNDEEPRDSTVFKVSIEDFLFHPVVFTLRSSSQKVSF